ncbi:hypothetical protein K2W90_03340 [Candidatus Babeliales bacterium]|nr:hypothetical protein [Candidatus Babeliales bacterium]
MKKVFLLALTLIVTAETANAAAVLLEGLGTVDAGISLVGTAYKYFNPETDQKCRESMITYASQEIGEHINDATTDLTENMDAQFESTNQKLNEMTQKIIDLEALLQESREYQELYSGKNDAELEKLIKTSGAIIGTIAAIPVIAGIVIWHKLMPLYQEMLEAKKAFASAPVATTYDLVRTNLFG